MGFAEIVGVQKMNGLLWIAVAVVGALTIYVMHDIKDGFEMIKQIEDFKWISYKQCNGYQRTNLKANISQRWIKDE